MEENKKEEVLEQKIETNEKVEETKSESNEEIKTENAEETKNENVEAVKNEAKETIKQVKEQMKDVNFKEEAQATKGFVTAIIKEPLEKIKEIANDPSNRFFKTALIILIIWTIAFFFNTISFTALKYATFGKGLWMVVRSIITPAVAVACLSLIIFVLNQKSENKKSLITIITTITTTYIPVIAASILSLLTLISSEVIRVTSRVGSLATVLSAVMLYFAVKAIFNIEDNKKAFIKFVVVYGIYMIASLVLSFIQISI